MSAPGFSRLPPLNCLAQTAVERCPRLPSHQVSGTLDRNHGCRHVRRPTRLPADIELPTQRRLDRRNDLANAAANATADIENAALALIARGRDQRVDDI